MAPNSIGAFLFNNQKRIKTLTHDFKSLLNKATQFGQLQKQRKQKFHCREKENVW
jgi:hypothetical protein